MSFGSVPGLALTSEALAIGMTRSPGLGEERGRELDALFTLIAEHPLMYQQIYKEVRRGLTRRFPYAIYFVVAAEQVAVLRVLHQARDPEEWRR